MTICFVIFVLNLLLSFLILLKKSDLPEYNPQTILPSKVERFYCCNGVGKMRKSVI